VHVSDSEQPVSGKRLSPFFLLVCDQKLSTMGSIMSRRVAYVGSCPTSCLPNLCYIHKRHTCTFVVAVSLITKSPQREVSCGLLLFVRGNRSVFPNRMGDLVVLPVCIYQQTQVVVGGWFLSYLTEPRGLVVIGTMSVLFPSSNDILGTVWYCCYLYSLHT